MEQVKEQADLSDVTPESPPLPITFPIIGSSHLSRTLPQAIYVSQKIFTVDKLPGFECQPGKMNGASSDTSPTKCQSSISFSEALKAWTERYNLGIPPIPVHRLDKLTTGVLLFARTSHAAKDLALQFRSRSISKTYLALCVESRDLRGKRSSGELLDMLYIGSDGRVSLKPDSFEQSGGKEAVTIWETLASSSTHPLALLRLQPHTGLKHQLRLQTAYSLRIPVLGDPLYSTLGSSYPSKSHQDMKNNDHRDHFSIVPALDMTFPPIHLPANRLFLHTAHTSLWQYRKTGPKKRYKLGISAALPRDFVEVCQSAGIDVPLEYLSTLVTVDGRPVNQEDDGGDDCSQ